RPAALRSHLDLPRRAGLSHMAQHGEEEAVVPSGALDLAFDGPLVGMLADEVEGELSDEGKVLRSVVLAATDSVFGEGDVEDPVELVLDGPVGPGDLEHALGGEHGGEQEEANDDGLGLAGC